MRRLISILGIVMLGALGSALVVSTAAASIYEGTVEFTCTTFTAAGTGASILDRDNTGEGQEALRIDVFDGVGNVIYTLSFENTLGTYAAGLINTTSYTTPPVANPLRMTLTSLAGNSLPEQVDVDTTGTCDTIPTVNCSVPAPILSGTAVGAPATVDNLCGTLEVTKVVEGAADPGTTFDVVVQCEAPVEAPVPTALPDGLVPPFEQTLTFGETGGTQSLTIVDGATCTATEPTQPPGCSLVSITPTDPVAIVNEETATISVTDTCQVTVSPLVVQPRFTG